jgi:hypothetical protein
MVRALRVDGQAVGQGRELGSVVHGSTLSTIPHSASITLAAHSPATAIKTDASSPATQSCHGANCTQVIEQAFILHIWLHFQRKISA